MKNLFLVLVVCILGVSCKKKYTCECSTIDVHQGFVNHETYHVKEKNKTAAMSNCTRQYEASGMATNGVNCQVN